MKFTRANLALAGLVAGLTTGAVVSLAGPASAATPTVPIVPDCKTVTVTLDARPDSGNHGTWALDHITRVAKVCHDLAAKDAVAVETWHYQATVTDTGTFVTVAGAHNSPNAGHAVLGGTPGTVAGGFTATFTALHDWGYWRGASFDGKTLTGAANGPDNPTTSDFVKALWLGHFEGSSINDDWAWIYRTCVKGDKCQEQWIDNVKTDGSGPKDGDIVGKPCPTPSTTATATATPTPTHTGTPTGLPSLHTGSPVVPAGDTSLPVTGFPVTAAVVGGVLLAGGGVALLLMVRRRRVRFEA